MQSILIKDTTREERIRIVNQSLQVCGQTCEFCNGCDNLGGGRVVTAYYCPGHAIDEMVFLDDYTRTLFSCDAVNYNTTMAAVPLPDCIRYLERLQELSDRYDDLYNGHHDFRALGEPLGKDCLPNIIDLAHQYLSGNYTTALVPSFWDGQRTPREMLRKGKNFLGFRAPSQEPYHKK